MRVVGYSRIMGIEVGAFREASTPGALFNLLRETSTISSDFRECTVCSSIKPRTDVFEFNYCIEFYSKKGFRWLVHLPPHLAHAR